MTTTTETRSRPILMSSPMVRALLREIERPGTGKTQTRRVVKGVEDFDDVCRIDGPAVPGHAHHCTCPTCQIETYPFWRFSVSDGGATQCRDLDSPFGRPGDELWVRETWRTEERDSDGVDGIRFRADDAFVPIENTDEAAERWAEAAHFKARPDEMKAIPGVFKGLRVAVRRKRGHEWRPGIHLPRWAARIKLTITEVRVERLQSITAADAKAEGIESFPAHYPAPYDSDGYIAGFAELWNRINGRRLGCGWELNPWTWAITFKPSLIAPGAA